MAVTKETKIFMSANDVKKSLATTVEVDVNNIDTVQKRKDGGVVLIVKETIIKTAKP